MVRMRRVSSLPDGSPTRVVPPPISVIGLPPVFCSQRSIMIESRCPTCSDGAGAVVADIGGEAAFGGERIQRFRVGALMDEAALVERAQEVGAERGHACLFALQGDRASFAALLPCHFGL